VVTGQRVFDGLSVVPSETVSGHEESCRFGIIATKVVVDKRQDDIIPLVFTLLQKRTAVVFEFLLVCTEEVQDFMGKISIRSLTCRRFLSICFASKFKTKYFLWQKT